MWALGAQKRRAAHALGRVSIPPPPQAPASPATRVFEIEIEASPPFCHAPCSLRVPAESFAELKAGIGARLSLGTSAANEFDVLVHGEDFDEFLVAHKLH